MSEMRAFCSFRKFEGNLRTIDSRDESFQELQSLDNEVRVITCSCLVVGEMGEGLRDYKQAIFPGSQLNIKRIT